MQNSKILLPALAFGLMAAGANSALAGNSCEAKTAATTPVQPVMVVDPFWAMQAQMAEMNVEMNRMMQAAFSAPHITEGGSFSSVSMETTPKEYRLAIRKSGVDEKDIKFSVADHVLTLRAAQDQIQKTSAGEVTHSGSWTQTMSLPADADTDHIQTSFKDGEYAVTIPRKAGAHPTSAKSGEGQAI